MRSDNLQGLTAADVAHLVDDLGLRRVVDLRATDESAQEGPGPLVRDGRVDIRPRSLYPDDGEPHDFLLAESDGEHPAVGYYLGYLRDRPDSIVGALDDIATGSGPVLVHCAAGKDRTGVVVALALSAVGVRREAIIADYVVTADRITEIMRRLRASPTYASALEGVTDESRKPQAMFLERVLEVLDERHGGPLGWLASQGFDPSDLRARLVA